MAAKLLFLLFALLASASSDPVCSVPGYCADSSLVGYIPNPNGFTNECQEACLGTEGCSGFYIALDVNNNYVGCYMVDGCDSFVPQNVEPDDYDARFLYWDATCL